MNGRPIEKGAGQEFGFRGGTATLLFPFILSADGPKIMNEKNAPRKKTRAKQKWGNDAHKVLGKKLLIHRRTHNIDKGANTEATHRKRGQHRSYSEIKGPAQKLLIAKGANTEATHR